MLISEIGSSHEIDPHFDEAIASPVGKFLPELSEILYHFGVQADQLCPCLTASLPSWLWSNPFSCKQLFPIIHLPDVVLNDFFLSCPDTSNTCKALEQFSYL